MTRTASLDERVVTAPGSDRPRAVCVFVGSTDRPEELAAEMEAVAEASQGLSGEGGASPRADFSWASIVMVGDEMVRSASVLRDLFALFSERDNDFIERFLLAVRDATMDLSGDHGHHELAELVAPFWSAERTRERLGISRSAMAERRRRGSILALETSDGQFFYPIAQFENVAGSTRVKPALRKFFLQLRGTDPWTVAMLANTPAPELDGLAPIDWLRSGGEEDVLVRFASTVAREWAR